MVVAFSVIWAKTLLKLPALTCAGHNEPMAMMVVSDRDGGGVAEVRTQMDGKTEISYYIIRVRIYSWILVSFPLKCIANLYA